MNLKNVKIGEIVEVEKLEIIDKKRLLELGIIPNKIIKKEYESIDKKMIAIKVNGTIICLRDSICENIFVKSPYKNISESDNFQLNKKGCD